MRRSRPATLAALLLIGYAVLLLSALDSYPLVWVDEAWESITAHTLVHEGMMRNPVLQGRPEGWDRIFLEPRILLSLLLAPVFALFGTGVLQGRSVSALAGLALVLVIFQLGSRAFSKRTGFLASLLIGLETVVFISARIIRPEIYLAVLITLSVLGILRGLESGRTGHFVLAGTSAGVALWTHPNAVLLPISFVVLFVHAERWRFIIGRRFWIVTASAVLAFLPYAAYVVLHDAANGLGTFWAQLAGRPEDVIEGGWLFSSLAGEWHRILDYVRFPYRLPAFLILMYALLRTAATRERSTQYILLVLGVHALGSLLLLSNKSLLYAATILPLIGVLAARYFDCALPQTWNGWLTDARARSPRSIPAAIGMGLLAVLAVNQIGGTAYLLASHRQCSYAEVVERLQQHIPPETRVWGSMTFWFGFTNQPYRTQYTYLKDLEEFNPHYVITGDREVWNHPFWTDVRTQMDDYVGSRGTLQAEIPTKRYGDLKIYRIRQDPDSGSVSNATSVSPRQGTR